MGRSWDCLNLKDKVREKDKESLINFLQDPGFYPPKFTLPPPYITATHPLFSLPPTSTCPHFIYSPVLSNITAILPPNVTFNDPYLSNICKFIPYSKFNQHFMSAIHYHYKDEQFGHCFSCLSVVTYMFLWLLHLKVHKIQCKFQGTINYILFRNISPNLHHQSHRQSNNLCNNDNSFRRNFLSQKSLICSFSF